MRHLLRGAFAAVALLALLGAAAPQPAPKLRSGLRGVRYCELLIVTHKLASVQAAVYNTLGLNDCPAAAWAKIDASALKKQLGATAVEKNGPRTWVIDAMSYQGSPTKRSFDGLAMRSVAVAHLPLSTLFGKTSSAYHETAISRSTIWVYSAGKPIFTLVSPDGVMYVMQSFSQIVDPKLAYADLPNLGARLHLPTGWSYDVFTPGHDLDLHSGGKAHVIQDDFADTYQRL